MIIPLTSLAISNLGDPPVELGLRGFLRIEEPEAGRRRAPVHPHWHLERVLGDGRGGLGVEDQGDQTETKVVRSLPGTF